MMRPSLIACFLAIGLTAIASGCTYTSTAFSGLECEEEGARDGDRECQGGLWITVGDAAPDLDMESPPDLSSPDLSDMPAAPADADMGSPPIDMPSCTPEEDDALCQADGRACGSWIIQDACDVMRQLDCGGCAPEETCDPDGQCVAECVPLSDAQLCEQDPMVACGTATLVDNCDAMRDVDCGGCESGECMENMCVGCEPQSDSDFCQEQYNNSSSCGMVTALDNCNMERVRDCGDTCQDDEVCANSVCCFPPSNEELCNMMAMPCGIFTGVVDACGMTRNLDCGACVIFSPDIAIPTTSGSPDDTQVLDEPPGGGSPNLLALWLRPSNGFNSPMTWNDSSGNMRHASISSPAAVNFISPGTDTNYSPMIDLSGNGYVEFPRPAAGDFTLAFVFRTNSSHSGSSDWWDEALMFGCELPGGVSDFGLTMEDGDLHFSHTSSDQVAVTTSGYDYGDDQVHVVIVRRDRDAGSDNVRLRVDGGTEFVGTMISGDMDACTNLRVGCQTDDDGKWTGEVGDVVVWESDQISRARIESSLAITYGITLGSDYVDHDGNSIYARSGYDQNIFGLARSDEHSLRKNRSTSSAPGAILTLRAGESATGGSLLTNDNSYLLVGHDGGNESRGRAITLDSGFTVDASQRTWRMQSTNFSQRFTITLDASDIDLFLDALVIADDASFTQNVRAYELKDIGADQSVVLELPANAVRYITFAESDP